MSRVAGVCKRSAQRKSPREAGFLVLGVGGQRAASTLLSSHAASVMPAASASCCALALRAWVVRHSTRADLPSPGGRDGRPRRLEGWSVVAISDLNLAQIENIGGGGKRPAVAKCFRVLLQQYRVAIDDGKQLRGLPSFKHPALGHRG